MATFSGDSTREMSPEMLASMPPQMRAMLEQHYSPQARGYPAAHQDERSPDAEAGSVENRAAVLAAAVPRIPLSIIVVAGCSAICVDSSRKYSG